MAQSLGDIIKQRLSAQQQPQATDETARTRGLLQARTGKSAGPGTSPAATSFGEEAINAQAATQMQQQSQQGQLLGEQQKQQGMEQQQTFALQQQKADQAQEIFRQQADQKLKELKEQARQGERALDLDKERAAVEQIGFLENLANKQYIDKLQLEGARARLDNDIEFKRYLKDAELQSLEGFLRNNLDFSRAFDADQRQFSEELSKIDINAAMDIAESAITAQNEASKWSSFGDLISTGAEAYADIDKKADNNSDNRSPDNTEGPVPAPSGAMPQQNL